MDLDRFVRDLERYLLPWRLKALPGNAGLGLAYYRTAAAAVARLRGVLEEARSEDERAAALYSVLAASAWGIAFGRWHDGVVPWSRRWPTSRLVERVAPEHAELTRRLIDAEGVLWHPVREVLGLVDRSHDEVVAALGHLRERHLLVSTRDESRNRGGELVRLTYASYPIPLEVDRERELDELASSYLDGCLLPEPDEKSTTEEQRSPAGRVRRLLDDHPRARYTCDEILRRARLEPLDWEPVREWLLECGHMFERPGGGNDGQARYASSRAFVMDRLELRRFRGTEM